MAAAPRWRATRALAASPACLAPPAAAYAVLLAWSWRPDTLALILPGSLAVGLAGGWAPQFIPQLAGVAALFARPATAASLWVHLLAVNLFAARAIYLDGLTEGVPTGAAVLLAAAAAPLGLLVHAAVKVRGGGGRSMVARRPTRLSVDAHILPTMLAGLARAAAGAAVTRRRRRSSATVVSTDQPANLRAHRP